MVFAAFSRPVIIRVLGKIPNWGVTGTVTVVVGGKKDYDDAVWVRGADSVSTSNGNGWGDGEEGRRRNLPG